MATITIKYEKPAVVVPAEVAQICPLFLPTNSYVDTEPYDGTIYDTNVWGLNTWEGLAAYLEKITDHPGILIMFKAAVRDGEATFEEADAKVVEYIKEVGVALAGYGFTVEAAEGAAADGEEH